MKKMLIACISVLFLFGLGACSQQKETNANQNSSVEPSSAKEQNTDNTVTLYLTRHGETLLNKTDRVQGWADAPLTKEGKVVAEYLGKGLKDIPFKAAYSGDSGRHISTAKTVLKNSGQADVKLVQDNRLREWYFGKFEGDLNENMWDEISKANGVPFEKLMRTVSLEKIANTIAKLDETGEAENWKQITTRTREALDDISKKAAENGGGNVLVVSSGLSINALLESIDPKFTGEQLENASITKLTCEDGKYKIDSYNDMSYVEKGKELK
ncbi:histidine phosphatase family protein [Virgibacillus sp. 179-BFC.A HS]|uniref:Histidine phosphatase family protein n=1 Tax=Tigheibacillus jepli TaxID=3035914 RepID=A0ABU5CK93_9BACI|nr:histidine phosphatase family protein [Virgibacillus sp. 179-BFC.A HS]MDY0406726.1 histidine phosphatase family protein [Virgibacillus sp. 179-BFC.A HS]